MWWRGFLLFSADGFDSTELAEFDTKGGVLHSAAVAVREVSLGRDACG